MREKEQETGSERKRKRVEDKRDITLQGKWKTKEERSGVGGQENRALTEPLNSSAGVQKRLVCMANGIFNNP